MFQGGGVEVEELSIASISRYVTRLWDSRTQHTLMVPSSVLATTTLSSASLARPVIHRSSFFLFPLGRKRLATFAGQGPTLNVRRRMPDCMLYMLIVPVDEAVRPKLPQAVTHTDYGTL